MNLYYFMPSYFSHLLPYLRVRPLGRVTEVIFPSGSHAVGRSGTSFSGSRAVCAWGHQEPQSSAKTTPRRQDCATRAIVHFASHNILNVSPPLKTHGGKVKAIKRSTLRNWHSNTHSTVPFTRTLKSCGSWWFTDMMGRSIVFTQNYSCRGKEIAVLYYSGMCGAAWHSHYFSKCEAGC